MFDFRQGDVGFVRDRIPQSAKRISCRPFALGEVTGHSHSVITEALPFVEMHEDADGTIWVRALEAIPVKHEDHDPAATKSILPKGWEGRVVIAREYDEQDDFRPVED